MHALLIHQAFASPNDAGGTRHFELAQRVLKRGHRFTIVASDLSYLSGKPHFEKRRLVTEEAVDGVRVLRAYTHPSLHRSFVWRVVAFLSFMVTSVVAGIKAGPVDLVIGTSPPIFQSLSAWLVAWLRRKPFLLEVRDLWPAFAIDMGVLKNPVLIRMSTWLERFLYRSAAHILVNSPAYRDYIVSKGFRPEKVSLIPNGVDTGMFDGSMNGARFREQWGADGKFVVTYAGALGMANDIPTLLGAAKALKAHAGIHFMVVGDGKERGNLQKLAESWGLENVSFTGPRPKAEMPGILAASDACVAILKDIPMFRTTYPNKVFDYMAAGRPTLLAIDGVIREVIEQSGGGVFVPPGDSEALGRAVKGLSDDREGSKIMGDSARRYVAAHFNRERQAADFVRLLEGICGKSG